MNAHLLRHRGLLPRSRPTLLNGSAGGVQINSGLAASGAGSACLSAATIRRQRQGFDLHEDGKGTIYSGNHSVKRRRSLIEGAGCCLATT